MNVTNITRLAILQKIVDNLQQYTQWVGDTEFDGKYLLKAEALIEVLEIHDCGSTGGFDRNNPRLNNSKNEIFDRFLTLLNKYPGKHTKKLTVGCGFTLETLQRFYDALEDLRTNAIQGRI